MAGKSLLTKRAFFIWENHLNMGFSIATELMTRGLHQSYTAKQGKMALPLLADEEKLRELDEKVLDPDSPSPCRNQLRSRSSPCISPWWM